jgi:hypothetical protein
MTLQIWYFTLRKIQRNTKVMGFTIHTLFWFLKRINLSFALSLWFYTIYKEKYGIQVSIILWNTIIVRFYYSTTPFALCLYTTYKERKTQMVLSPKGHRSIQWFGYMRCTWYYTWYYTWILLKKVLKMIDLF